jgi:lipopolysaccharide export system protein LptC
MKANEILMRQDRVVYVLMLLVASLGLLWSFWQHQHPSNAGLPKAEHQATAILPAANTATLRSSH